MGGRGGAGSANQIGVTGGGYGGGNLKLNVGGTLRVDGKISADGLAGPPLNSGGGGGGAVTLSAGTLAGSGIISANGGAGNFTGGGGGGGRISMALSSNGFNGTIMARGGGGANYGGAGFVYLTANPAARPLFLTQLTVDNGGVRGGYTPIPSSPPQGNFNLTVAGGAILVTSNSFSSLTLQNLLIGSNSTWLANFPSSFTLNVQTNATIQAGGLLTSDGSIVGGPSGGQSLGGKGGGGGGHGGYGGMSLSNALGGIVTSDSIHRADRPRQFRRRGRWQWRRRIAIDGARRVATGRKNIRQRRDQQPVPNSGGGSGGSIFLLAGKLSGAGVLSVNGGAGNLTGGGGGGGRIAILYNTNSFTGAVTARGGAGAHFGGAGTIYTTSSFTAGQGKSTQLIVDNGGNRGANTLIPSPATVTGADVTIGSGATVTVSANGGPINGSRWNNLIISSNASITLEPSYSHRCAISRQ